MDGLPVLEEFTKLNIGKIGRWILKKVGFCHGPLRKDVLATTQYGPVWQGSGSSKNSSGSDSLDGAASLVELEPF